MPEKDKKNVLYIYKGVQVRKSNRVVLRFSETIYKRIIDACEESGMSVHKVLYFSGRPCERCDAHVVVYDKDGQPKRIKKGILNLPEGNGVNIIEKAKIKKCKKP